MTLVLFIKGPELVLPSQVASWIKLVLDGGWRAADRDLCLLVCPDKDLPCLVEGGKILVAKCRTNTRSRQFHCVVIMTMMFFVFQGFIGIMMSNYYFSDIDFHYYKWSHDVLCFINQFKRTMMSKYYFSNKVFHFQLFVGTMMSTFSFPHSFFLSILYKIWP